MTFEQKKEKITQLIKNNPEYQRSGFGITIGTFINSRAYIAEHINKSEDLESLSKWIFIMFKEYADDFVIDKKYHDNDLGMSYREKITYVRNFILTNKIYRNYYKTSRISINCYIAITEFLIISDLSAINNLDNYSEFLLDCYLEYYESSHKDPCAIYRQKFNKKIVDIENN